jgi:Sulfotransferase family
VHPVDPQMSTNGAHRPEHDATTPTPLFVCGVARSGTTLLAALLDNHPSLLVLEGETHYYEKIFLRRRLLGRLLRAAALFNLPTIDRWLALGPVISRIHADRVASMALLREWHGYFADMIPLTDGDLRQIVPLDSSRPPFWPSALRLAARLTGGDIAARRYFVEKTPGNERYVFLMEHDFRGTGRYLHIVRDPRAVAASRVAGRQLVGAARDHSVDLTCYMWATSLDYAIRNWRRCGTRYTLLRYEDLVEAPAQTVERIQRRLELPHTADLLRPTRFGLDRSMNSSYRDAQHPSPIVTTSTGRYTDVLTEIELARIERALHAQMNALGYAPERVDGTPRQGRLGGTVKDRTRRRRVESIQRAFRHAGPVVAAARR